MTPDQKKVAIEFLEEEISNARKWTKHWLVTLERSVAVVKEASDNIAAGNARIAAIEAAIDALNQTETEAAKS